MKLLALTILVVIAASEAHHCAKSEFLRGLNKLSADVYTNIKSNNPGSFVVSPLSADLVLALVEYGSKGKTSEELVEALGLPKDKTRLREAITSIIPKLDVHDPYTLTSAIKVYIKEGYKLNNDFKQFATDVYHAEAENIDFEKKDDAAEKMNKWVADKTLQKIKNLVNKDDLDQDTRAILLNALYFQGTWETNFDPSDTAKDVFYYNSKDSTQLELMEVTNSFKYLEDLDAKFIELPYKADSITLTIALPNDKDGLEDLESKMANVLDRSNYTTETINVKIPKFKIETEIEFKPILEKLGIVKAFTDQAEFPGITEEKLKISKVVQKAFIEVDEYGTTAAASTAVVLPNIRSQAGPRHPKKFIADHPFIFVLKCHNLVLFTGKFNGKNLIKSRLF